MLKKRLARDFLGDPVAKTLCIQCRGLMLTSRVQLLVRELDPIQYGSVYKQLRVHTL